MRSLVLFRLGRFENAQGEGLARRGNANAARVRHEYRTPQRTWSFNGGEAVSTAREGSLDARQERDERILAANDLIGVAVIGVGVEDRI